MLTLPITMKIGVPLFRLVIVRGNPRVRKVYPYPDPPEPLPFRRVPGVSGVQVGVQPGVTGRPGVWRTLKRYSTAAFFTHSTGLTLDLITSESSTPTQKLWHALYSLYVPYSLSYPSSLPSHTVSSKTIAMFGSLGLIVMQCLTAWKLRLALVGWSKVLLLGFLSVFYS